MVKEKAIELTTCPDFIASKGWLDKFKIRYNLDIAKEATATCLNPGSKPSKHKTEDLVSESDEKSESTPQLVRP